MLIYTSPNTGKTTFCKSHPDFIDGDNILKDIICQRFKIKDIDMNNFSHFILELYNKDKWLIEQCYTEYMNQLKQLKYSDTIVLFGTRRFMWLADRVYLELNKSSNRSDELINKELESADKWNVKYARLKGKYVSDFLT